MEGRRQASERDEDSRVAAAWYVEAFARQKRLPKLEQVLARPGEQSTEQTPDDMLRVMEAIQAAGGMVTIEEIDGSEYGFGGLSDA